MSVCSISEVSLANKATAVDLGQAAWSRISGKDLPSALPARPAPSTLGSALKITLNTFDVTEFPTKKVYQFEVLVGSGAEKRGLSTLR